MYEDEDLQKIKLNEKVFKEANKILMKILKIKCEDAFSFIFNYNFEQAKSIIKSIAKL